MEKIIEVSRLTKKYGDFTAVDEISFDLIRGEIFGFLGPNGAGKTTTINMMTGMARITAGNIRFNGRDLTGNIRKAQEIIGVVPDESNLYDEMNGFDNLGFCGALYGLSKSVREKKAAELLEIFQLTEAPEKKFKSFSKGMKRKLTIAAALIHHPQILFLDEPTTGIDVASARQIRDLIKKLNTGGMTIFLTTHYIEEAERLCRRVAFINRGEILGIDTVSNLLNDAREANVIEVVFEHNGVNRDELLSKFNQKFSRFDCSLKQTDTIRIIGHEKIDIAPVVSWLSSESVFIREARLVRPTLEDAFIKITGIGMDLMKKEKEKK